MDELIHLIGIVLVFFRRSERFCKIVGQGTSDSKNFSYFQNTTTKWAVSNDAAWRGGSGLWITGAADKAASLMG
jgi:hypothetical protein